MRRATLLLIAAVGCSKAPAPAPKAEATPVPVVPVVAVVPEPRPAAPVIAPFRFPNDTGGKAVAAVLEPSVPREPTPITAKPRPRTSALDSGELPLPKAAVAVPRAPLPKAKMPKLTPPAERIPTDLGITTIATQLPEGKRVRAPSPPAPSAADVPSLARQVPDRASLDDPATEIAANRVVFTRLSLPFSPSWFVRFTIPDPFELAEQMKAKTGTVGELGTKPVNVPPVRPR